MKFNKNVNRKLIQLNMHFVEKGVTHIIILTCMETAFAIMSVWPLALREKIDNNELETNHVALSYAS